MSAHMRRQRTFENSLPSQMLALEPRYLFDAAAITTAMDVTNDPGALPPALSAVAVDLVDDGQQFLVTERAAPNSTAFEITGGSFGDGLINRASGTGTLSYTITGGTGQTAFDITSDGAIHVIDPSQLDYESNPETLPNLTLVIQAENTSGDTDSTTITVLIANSSNEAPEINGTVTDETITAGTTLTKNIQTEASPTDDDAGDPINYSLLSPPANAMIDYDTGEFTWDTGLSQTGTSTITVLVSNDGDPDQTTVVQFDVTVNPVVTVEGVTATTNTEVAEGITAEFIVKLSGASDQAATVTLSATDGTADASDYDGTQFYLDAAGSTPIAGNVLSFAAGDTQMSVFIITTDNDPEFNELNETFSVTATATSGSAGTDMATGTITDGSLPVVSIEGSTTTSNTTATEGQAMKFTVKLSGVSDQPASVALAATDGSAEATDYTATQFYTNSGLTEAIPDNVLAFAAGVTEIDIYAGANIDAMINEIPDETFTLSVTATSGATGSGMAIGTIIDNTPIHVTGSESADPAGEASADPAEPEADAGEDGDSESEDSGEKTEDIIEEAAEETSNPDAPADGGPADQGEEVNTEEAAEIEAEIEAFIAEADFSETSEGPAAGKPESQPQQQTRAEEVAEILSIMDKAAALVSCGG